MPTRLKQHLDSFDPERLRTKLETGGPTAHRAETRQHAAVPDGEAPPLAGAPPAPPAALAFMVANVSFTAPTVSVD